MNDLVSRQAAIDEMMALQEEDIEAYGCSIPEGFDGERASEALRRLPSVDVIKLLDDGTLIIDTDLMDRVNRVLVNHGVSCKMFYQDTVEVIRCRDCKHHAEFSSKCNKLCLTPMWPSDFCSYGERAET